MSLQEIKDNYAKLYIGDPSATWNEFKLVRLEPFEDHMDSICEMYARECVRASLEKASNNAASFFNYVENKHGVIASSITNPENIVLL